MKTLLLADDSVTIQRVIELTFADEDIRVVAVSTGDQAIAAMEEGTPDIVLADIGMPGRSGYEIARYVRATPRLAHTRVLLLAGAFDPVDRDGIAALGCDGVLVKPFEPQQVIATVRELLSPDGNHAARDRDIATPTVPEKSASNLDEYFERLDRALGGPPTSPGSGPSTPPVTPSLQPSRGDQPIGTGASSAGRTQLPSLPDAFAALLAAEESGPDTVPVVWPDVSREAPSDALVEEVVRRVLARLPENVLTGTVAGIVSSVAERLIKEEIERIKASIDPPAHP